MNKKLKELLYKKQKALVSLDKLDRDIQFIHLNTQSICAKCGHKEPCRTIYWSIINWKGIVAEYQYVCYKCNRANRILFTVPSELWSKYVIFFGKHYIRIGGSVSVYRDENEPAKKNKFVNNFYFQKLIEEELDFNE